MGKIVKNNLRRIIALIMAMTLVVPAVLADGEDSSGEFTYESELLKQEEYMQVSNFVLDDWAAARCGYSENRKIYHNDSVNKNFMQFTAPEGKKFTSAEFLVTLHHNSHFLLEKDEEKSKRIFVSENGIDWTAVEQINVVKDEKVNVDGGANHYNYTVSANIPEGAKYIRLEFGWANGTWQIFVHHMKLGGKAIQETPVFDNALITTPDNVTQNGFSSVPWAAARCGYSEARNIWYSSTGAYAVFDAGIGNAYTSGEFDITVNATKFWMIQQDAYRNGGIIKASDDGENWVNISAEYTTPVRRDDNGNISDSAPWETIKLSFNVGTGYRYIKFDTQAGNGSFDGNLFIHHAKFYGGASAKPIYESELKAAESWVTANGFGISQWAGVRCGYASDRPMYVSNGTSSDITENSLIFTAPETKAFTNAEFLVTLHAARAYQIEQSVNDRVMISDDGNTWVKAPNVYFAKDSTTYYDGSTAHYNYTLSAEIPKGAKYVKLTFNEVGGWQSFVHHVKLYGGKIFEVTSSPSATVNENSVEITGAYETINTSGEDVYAAVYDGVKLAGIGKVSFDKSRNEKELRITVNTDGVQNPVCKLFIWSKNGEKPLTGKLDVSVVE